MTPVTKRLVSGPPATAERNFGAFLEEFTERVYDLDLPCTQQWTIDQTLDQVFIAHCLSSSSSSNHCALQISAIPGYWRNRKHTYTLLIAMEKSIKGNATSIKGTKRIGCPERLEYEA
jgi:hypothetical protein